MSDCIFCKIGTGEIPARFAYRDDDVFAIEDLSPQAPGHLLVIPRKHYSSVADLAAEPELVAKVFTAAAQLGRDRAPGGYRLVANTGADGGQTVDHVHVHVLSGRQLHWPPG